MKIRYFSMQDMFLSKQNETRLEKTGFLPVLKKAQISGAVTAQMISAFVFTTQISRAQPLNRYIISRRRYA